MRRPKSVLLLFFLVTSQLTFACDCGSQGEFLKVAPKTDFVALVKISKYLTFREIYDKQVPMSMEVEVINVYKGTEARKTITVWGDYGHLCRPYLSRFDTGNYYVIAFYKGLDGSKGNVHKNERPTDYFISVCGDYWLMADIKKQVASGSLTEKQTQIKLADLKSRLWKK